MPEARAATEPVEEFSFCEEEGVISPVDRHFSTYRRPYSPIYILFEAESNVKRLEAKILGNQFDFLAIAKLPMKAFLKFADKGVPISDEDANNLLRGVWLHPCFLQSLAAAIHDDIFVISTFMFYRKQDSVADRIAHMVADSSFKPSVLLLKEPTPRSTFLRLFLSILIGHWGPDEGLLRTLDQRMEKNVFGQRFDEIAEDNAEIAKEKALSIKRDGKKDEIEEFSYVVSGTADITRAKVMDPLRKLMVERYGQREDRDIEAILKKDYVIFGVSVASIVASVCVLVFAGM